MTNRISGFAVLLQIIIVFCNIHSFRMQTSTPSQSCGPYSFRCLDQRRFQICPYQFFDESEEPEEPGAVYECREGFTCDEDSPAYCIPMVAMATMEPSIYDRNRALRLAPMLRKVEAKKSRRAFNRKSKIKQTDDCDCDDDFLVTAAPTTTTTTEEATTEFSLERLVGSRYDCDSYGFQPDHTNHSLFWNCDVPKNGQGYVARQMICGRGRIFDPKRRLCVLVGTTPHIAKKQAKDHKIRRDEDSKEIIKHSRQKENNTQVCDGKSRKKFPDENDCKAFYICLPSKSSPHRLLRFRCPSAKAYDPEYQKCTRLALQKRCSSKSGLNYVQDYTKFSELKTQQTYPVKFSSKIYNSLKFSKPEDDQQNMEKRITVANQKRFRNSHNCEDCSCCDDQNIKMKCPRSSRLDTELLKHLSEQEEQSIELPEENEII